ncbi:MAG: hypothetical protein WAQ05_00135, partial [Rubrivivax sp.]
PPPPTRGSAGARLRAAGLERSVLELVPKAVAAAGTRGGRTGEARDGEHLQELAAKGMRIDARADGLKRELQRVGGRMTADWLQSAGAEGRAVIDACRKP